MPFKLKNQPVIGVDFDNTLVCYDQVFYSLAVEQGFVPKNKTMHKAQVRSLVRTLPDGEKKWQRLQASAYGERLSEASLFPGIHSFFSHCATQKGYTIYIVSHKTPFAAADTDKSINLQDAALAYMHNKKFFSAQGLGLSRSNVFFEETRSAKIKRIKSLECKFFIDDLEELFLAPDFPQDVHKVLFSPSHQKKTNNIAICKNWKEVKDCLF